MVETTKAFGPAAAALRGTSVPVGERLTGWVAARRQPIVNFDDATLDLGARVSAVAPPLSRRLSVPLMVGDALVAVLTLYTASPDGFTADQGPHRPDRGAPPRQNDRRRYAQRARELRERAPPASGSAGTSPRRVALS